MNKRGFLKSIVALSIAPSLFLPKTGNNFKWKKSAKDALWIVNPEYITAPYQMTACYAYGFNPDYSCLTPIMFKRGSDSPVVENHFVLERFNADGSPVPAYILSDSGKCTR